MQIFHISFNPEYLCLGKGQKNRRCDDSSDHLNVLHSLACHTEFAFIQYSIMRKFTEVNVFSFTSGEITVSIILGAQIIVIFFIVLYC